MSKKDTLKVFRVSNINRAISYRRTKTRKQIAQTKTTLSHNMPIVTTQVINMHLILL